MSERPTPPNGFVDSERVRKDLGLFSSSWLTMLRRADVPLFSDPRDKRRRLIREVDLGRLGVPLPAKRKARPTPPLPERVAS